MATAYANILKTNQYRICPANVNTLHLEDSDIQGTQHHFGISLAFKLEALKPDALFWVGKKGPL